MVISPAAQEPMEEPPLSLQSTRERQNLESGFPSLYSNKPNRFFCRSVLFRFYKKKLFDTEAKVRAEKPIPGERRIRGARAAIRFELHRVDEVENSHPRASIRLLGLQSHH